MTAVHSERLDERTETNRQAGRSTRAVTEALKVLAVVDGSERTGRVLEYLVGLAGRSEAIEVVVLNVQPIPEDWRLRGYITFKRSEIVDRLVNDLGKPVVASFGRQLDKAGIIHKGRIELGDPAETIVRCAVAENCHLILVSEPRTGFLRRWLTRTTGLSFGSMSNGVVQLADIPVVVVK